jgi:hypothetical protein
MDEIRHRVTPNCESFCEALVGALNWRGGSSGLNGRRMSWIRSGTVGGGQSLIGRMVNPGKDNHLGDR